MTYQLQLAAVAAPESDLDVFPFMNKLRQEAGDKPPSALLQRFHQALATLFPDSPWSESHYCGDAGRLTLARRSKEVVPHVLFLASELGLTVVDNQSGEVHRPPRYQVVLEGPAPGVELGDAASRLAALMRKPVTEMLALLSGGRRTVVKKGVLRAQARQYVAALKEHAGCHATLALEAGQAERPAPPPPTPAAAPAPLSLQKPAAAKAAPAAAGLALEPVAAAPAAGSAAASPAMAPFSRREPDAATVDPGADPRLFMLADSLRLAVYATVLYLVTAYVFRQMAGWPKGILALGVTALAMAAVYRVAKGAGSNIVMRILAMACIIIPLINVVVLFLMIRRGKVALRENAVGAGWFGPSEDDIVRLRGGKTGLLPSTIIGWVAALSVFGLFSAGKRMGDQTIDAVLGGHPQPCAIVGVWSSSKLGPDGKVLMQDDGTYFVVPLEGKEDKVKQEQGEWAVRNSNFVWQVPLPDRPWIMAEHIETFKLSLDGRSITMFDRRAAGLFTEWRRVGNLKSDRCRIN
ncbi:hypothetical protein [Pseudoduganella sp. HUAS MS19]